MPGRLEVAAFYRDVTRPARRTPPPVLIHPAQTADIPAAPDALCGQEVVCKVLVRPLTGEELGQEHCGAGAVAHPVQ